MIRLWRGELPLARVFWEFAFVYGTLINLVATLLAMVLLTRQISDGLALAAYLLPLPYDLLMVVAVWRSAGRYPGSATWANLARGAVVVWALLAVVA